MADGQGQDVSSALCSHDKWKSIVHAMRVLENWTSYMVVRELTKPIDCTCNDAIFGPESPFVHQIYGVIKSVFNRDKSLITFNDVD